MKLGNKEIKLFYSNYAVQELTELCGGKMNNIGSLLRGSENEEMDASERINNIVKLVRVLANGEIARNNKLIELGIIDGEKQERFTDEDISMLVDVSKIDEYLMEVFEVMGLASKFVTPNNLQLTEPDLDLEEIESEKNP